MTVPTADPAGRIWYSPGHLARLLGLPEPTVEQAAVISAPLEPLAVIAGAGSGKSETMAARLVWLAANGMVRPEQVLGLTFTRKAAGELGQRVRARLAGLRRAGVQVAGPAGGPKPGAGAGAGARDQQPGAADGGLLWNGPAGDGQRGAGDDGSLWGAGSGDPRRGAGEGGPPRGGPAGDRGTGANDLASAAGKDGAALAGPLDGEPVVSTYHAYAARLVADHALREALEPTLRLITPAVAWQVAARTVSAYPGPMDAVTWVPPQVTAAVLALAGELAEHLRDPADVRGVGSWLRTACETMPGTRPAMLRKILECQRIREQLLPIVSAYAGAKAAREVIDYGDQVALAARIATRHPEVGAIERARYPVVLLDEFQDTSHAQLVLLQALFGAGHPVTAVGDPCQSIYGWRGASAGNLRRFAELFPTAAGEGPAPAALRPGLTPTWQGPARPAASRPATVRVLATSFRNTQRVLEAAAALQRGLREQAPLVPRLVPPPSRAGRGSVVCALLETAAGEARWVAERIERLLRLPPAIAPDGKPWPQPSAARVQPSDVAVLCRKRSQFPALRTAIEARGIPVEVVGLGGLLTVPEVADIVATLRALHDPGASGALARLLTGPRWRIGPRDLVALGRRARALAAGQREAGDPGSPGSAARPGSASQPPAGSTPAGDASVGPKPADASAGPKPPGASVGPKPADPSADPKSADASAGSKQAKPGTGANVAEPRAGSMRADPAVSRAGGTGAAEVPAGTEAEVPAGRDDAIAEAVEDLTADPGSLAEALDDLGDPAAYSAAGYARFSALAAELRSLHAHVGRPLPDLVGEVERVLGLDIEVAAQPWRDPVTARADLDAFADAAAAFADDEEEPTLGAFLAYLTAAELEEFGLESGQPSGANAVTLTTVHAAKGLQWAAVVVPGLSAGHKAQVFPAKPRVTTRWTENPRLLPFGLRGDSGDLPALDDLTAESLAAFASACSARELAEERRLAYVAVTRAAFWVACTGYWWGEASSRLGPSVFLEEVRAACEDGAGTVAHWAPEPDEDSANPALAEPPAGQWPAEPSGPYYEAAREAAALVEEALRAMGAAGADRPAEGRPAPPAASPRAENEGTDEGGGPGDDSGADEGGGLGDDGGGAGERGGAGDAGVMSKADRELVRAWARDTGLLLRELAERRGDAAAAVRLPDHLSVSALVSMAADPARLAQQIRRPMPRPPAPQARRGTAFHRWLEERFGQQRLIDPADLLGAADDPADDEDAADLTELRNLFEAGEWGSRWPVEVEVPFETLIAGRTVRGRIDAVFADQADGYDVVDWKTGRPPESPDELRAAAVQLGAYRLAWARLAGVPLDRVRAGFYYVRDDLTLRPADLLGEDGLAALIEDIPLAT